jgi:hypothetical protein
LRGEVSVREPGADECAVDWGAEGERRMQKIKQKISS